MPADTYGAVNFGLSTEEGFYIESASFDFSAQELWHANTSGDDVVGAVFKHEGTFSLEGPYKTDDTESWVLGTVLTVANLADADLVALIPGYTTGASYIITGANINLGNEQLEGRTISGVIKPFLAAKN